jgi:hypothetical protein
VAVRGARSPSPEVGRDVGAKRRQGGEERNRASVVRDWRSPPGLGCASPSLPIKGREKRRRMTLRRRCRRLGEGAERPGLARCECVLPFRRSRPPRVAVFHAPSGWRPLLRALPDLRRSHCWLRRAADRAYVSGPHIQRAASKRKAIHRPPRGPPRYPSPGLHRSTTARRHRGVGSDALPTDGMGRSLARVPAMMAGDAVIFERRAESEGWRGGIC